MVLRFIDAEAEFLDVPAVDVLATAAATGATPCDVPGVAMSHVGELCSFDAFLLKYPLIEPALDRLATIVRGADTARLDLAPQSAGLYAISLGVSRVLTDDHAMLRHGLVMYDALYAWCRGRPSRDPPLAARWRTAGGRQPVNLSACQPVSLSACQARSIGQGRIAPRNCS